MDTGIACGPQIRCSMKGSKKMGTKAKKSITRTLMKLGNIPSIKGFHYLKEGIQFCLKDSRSVTNLQKLLYPKIAEKFDTTPQAVERAARMSIQTSWHRRDRELTEEIFSNSLQTGSDIPSNSLYIAAITEWILDDEE